MPRVGTMLAVTGRGELLDFGLVDIIEGLGIFVIIIGIIGFLITRGSWTSWSWARVVAIIFAIIGLLGFPLDTVISIIILWYLINTEIKSVFHQTASFLHS